MMNSSALDRRTRLAEEAIKKAVRKGETIRGRNRRLNSLRDLLRRFAEEGHHPGSHFDIISDVDLLELYINVVERVRDHNAIDQALPLRLLTLQGTESIGEESKGQGFVPPPVPMPPTSEFSRTGGSSDAGKSEEGEEGEKFPSYKEDARSFRIQYPHRS
jgi:hypothetical protein